MGRQETFYELIRRQGISRRNFLKFCSLSAASLGLAPHFAGKIAHAMETKPRVPVLWLHGLECTCCTESFIRSAHPLAKDVILSLVSLDYDDTIMAAAGPQAEQIIEEVMRDYKGQYILAVEGNPPLAEDGIFCIPGGRPFIEKLKHVAGVVDTGQRGGDAAELVLAGEQDDGGHDDGGDKQVFGFHAWPLSATLANRRSGVIQRWCGTPIAKAHHSKQYSLSSSPRTGRPKPSTPR